MFWYESDAGESYESSQNLRFAPQFTDETSLSSLPSDADQVCDTNVQCLHDYSVTSDQAIAAATRRTADQLVRAINILSQ